MNRPFDILATVARKRDGHVLAEAEIAACVGEIVAGRVPDYQITALLMAMYLRGLDDDETAALTRSITASGERLDFSDLGPVVDKHSTGGVGDTVSLIAAPLAAACGVVVPMISGRALAHTGGTLDKLESVPGLRTALPTATFRHVVERTGLAIVEAGPTLAPGDAILYRLRGASATIASPGLIIASIFGKKLCVTPHGLIMDLKFGRGSFLGKLEAARAMAARMTAVGHRLGLQARFLLTDMQTPLSSAVGNAVEIERAIRLLGGEVGSDHLPDRGRGLHGERLLSLSLTIAGEMIALAGRAPDARAGREAAATALADGHGLDTWRRMLAAQGGDERVVDDPSRLPRARERQSLLAGDAGILLDMDAAGVGEAAARLGVGRDTLGAAVDPGAGLVLHVQIGDRVARGDRLAELGAADVSRLAAGLERLDQALRIGEAPAGAPLEKPASDPVRELFAPPAQGPPESHHPQ